MDLTLLNSFISRLPVTSAEEMTFSYVTAVVITGLSVVFLGLIVLIIFVWAFGKIFSRKKSAPPAMPKSASVAKPAAPAAVKPKSSTAGEADNDEIIAVIAAAVAAMGASEGKNYKLRSVKAVKNKPSRSAWSMAGIQNDTTPF